MSTVTIELSEELAARLAAASESQQVPPAQIVQEALDRVLPLDDKSNEAPADGESLYEQMKDFIGCIDAGVSDLATNPKYLEGFGQSRK